MMPEDVMRIVELIGRIAADVLRTGQLPDLSEVAKELMEILHPPASAPEPVATETGVEVSHVVLFGSYGHEAAATQEATLLRHPDVFFYRSGVFPQPKAFGVKVQVMRAIPQQLPEEQRVGMQKLNPWTVELAMCITGLETAVQRWIEAFNGMARLQLVQQIRR